MYRFDNNNTGEEYCTFNGQKEFEKPYFHSSFDMNASYSRSLVSAEYKDWDMSNTPVANYIQHDGYLYFAGYKELLGERDIPVYKEEISGYVWHYFVEEVKVLLKSEMSDELEDLLTEKFTAYKAEMFDYFIEPNTVIGAIRFLMKAMYDLIFEQIRPDNHSITAQYVKASKADRIVHWIDSLRTAKLREMKKNGDFDDTIVFGRINLSSIIYEIEVLHECCCIWKHEIVIWDLVFSVSQGKLWFISPLNDAPGTPENDRGELALKYINLDSRQQKVAMIFDMVQGLRTPIVQGNVLAYYDEACYGGCFKVKNLLTKETISVTGKTVVGYNCDFIFLGNFNGRSIKAENNRSDISVVSTVTGNSDIYTELLHRFPESVHYVDCGEYQCLGRTNDGAESVVYFSIRDRNTPELEIRSFVFDNYFPVPMTFDGNNEAAVFNAILYTLKTSEYNKNNGVFSSICPEDNNADYIFPKSEWHNMKNFPCSSCHMAAADDLILCDLGNGWVSMFYNDKWRKILRSC